MVGRGGMGEVWEALLHGFQGFRRKVALKVLPPSSDARDVLVREARLGALLSHPNVVATHDVGESDGRCWIAMELVTGASLREIGREGPLSGRALVEVGIQTASALSHVHGLVVEGRPLGLVHRDVKPSNLLVDRSGLVKLADLGVARLASEVGRIGGTPSFMPPEQREGGGDARSDLFALGATLLRLVTQRPLFPPGATTARIRQHLAHLVADPTAWREVDDVSPGLSEVLRGCLGPEPEHRLPSAAALLDALQAIRALQPPGPSLLDRLARVRPDLAPAPDPTSEPRSASALTSARPGRLPRPADAFVGREADRAAVIAEVSRGGGLVTLLGPGGTGKTRLSLEVAHQVLPDLPGGAWFVDLSEASDAEGVLAAVASTFTVALERTDPATQLGHALRGHGRVLVILDNLEQVVDAAAPLVERWVDAAPEASFLATSRIALRLRAERRLPLGPLPVVEATELFRARAPRPLDADELAELPRLVTELDGLPLAIELAAARVRIVPVAGIRERLVDRMRLLAGGGRERPERHRSLRASLDGSWELLSPWQQAAMSQLSVFEGGFSHDAADAVLDLSAHATAPWGLDVLEGLVDASLVRVEERGERFRMLVSVQVYAAEHLTGDERAAAELRHGRWYAQLGSDAALGVLLSPTAPARMALLRTELDNLAAAARRAVARLDRPVAFAATRAAVAFLRMHGPASRASELLEAALSLGEREPEARPLRVARAALRREQGRTEESIRLLRAELAERDDDAYAQSAWTELGIALQEAQQPGAREHHERAMQLGRQRGDRSAEAQAQANLGTLLLADGQREEARRLFEAALVVHRELSSPRFVGMALANLGMIDAISGRRADASLRLEEGAAILERAGDRRSALVALGNLGAIAVENGDPERALALFEDVIRGHREIGARRFEAVALSQRGTALSNVGRYAEAERSLRESIAIHVEQHNPLSEIVALSNLADVQLRTERLAEAAETARAVLERARGPAPRFHVLAAVTLSEAALLAGDPDAARRWLDEARGVAPRAGPESVALTNVAEARLAEGRGEPGEAELLLRESLGALRAFERARAHATLARLARARGDRLTHRSELETARALAEPFGPRSLLAAEVAAARG